jgi:hypothetical protein
VWLLVCWNDGREVVYGGVPPLDQARESHLGNPESIYLKFRLEPGRVKLGKLRVE